LKKKVKSNKKQKTKKRREIFFAFVFVSCPKKEEQKQRQKVDWNLFLLQEAPNSTSFFKRHTLIIFTNSYYYAP